MNNVCTDSLVCVLTVSCGRSVVDMNTAKGTVEVKNPKGAKTDPPRVFTFDSVYNWE